MGIDRNIYVGSYLWLDAAWGIAEEFLRVSMGSDSGLFQLVQMGGHPGTFLVGNCRQDFYFYLKEDSGENAWSFLATEFTHPDWVRVMRLLRMKGIKYYNNNGIVQWFS